MTEKDCVELFDRLMVLIRFNVSPHVAIELLAELDGIPDEHLEQFHQWLLELEKDLENGIPNQAVDRYVFNPNATLM